MIFCTGRSFQRDCLYSTHIRQINIEHHEIRSQPAAKLNTFLGVSRFRQYIKLWDSTQYKTAGLTYQLVIAHNNDGYFFHGIGFRAVNYILQKSSQAMNRIRDGLEGANYEARLKRSFSN